MTHYEAMQRVRQVVNVQPNDIEEQTNSIRPEIYDRFLKEGDTVYDIGAFRGVLSVYFAARGYNVIAIEGSERNIDALRQNVQDYANVKTILMALHEKNQDEVFTKFCDCIGTPGQLIREMPVQKISYRTIPKLIEEHSLPIPKLIKIDIEGMESVVLKTCEYMFTTFRPIFQLSMHQGEKENLLFIEDYPGFVEKENGGFDFDKFSQNGYVCIDRVSLQLCEKPKGFSEYFLIPQELLTS